jgi:hypothetical protein
MRMSAGATIWTNSHSPPISPAVGFVHVQVADVDPADRGRHAGPPGGRSPVPAQAERSLPAKPSQSPTLTSAKLPDPGLHVGHEEVERLQPELGPTDASGGRCLRQGHCNRRHLSAPGAWPRTEQPPVVTILQMVTGAGSLAVRGDPPSLGRDVKHFDRPPGPEFPPRSTVARGCPVRPECPALPQGAQRDAAGSERGHPQANSCRVRRHAGSVRIDAPAPPAPRSASRKRPPTIDARACAVDLGEHRGKSTRLLAPIEWSGPSACARDGRRRPSLPGSNPSHRLAGTTRLAARGQ